MQTFQDNPYRPGTRRHREREYWDRVYEMVGRNFQNYAWMAYVEEATYNARFFHDLIRPLPNQKILSIGGGLDRFGVTLAREGHRVVCVDISVVAAMRTQELAQRAGVAGNLTARAASCEDMDFPPGTFDLVVSKRALHHMDIPRVVPCLHAVLKPGGVFLAEEPICLHPLVQKIHDRFPFYGDAPHTPDEKELTERDLALIDHTFRSTCRHYFDFLARESVAHYLHRFRWHRLLYRLGQTDYYLVNWLLRPLHRWCNYVILEAHKEGAREVPS
jgi:SAM-dependent methyltransferase